jgi:hypothetical protein
VRRIDHAWAIHHRPYLFGCHFVTFGASARYSANSRALLPRVSRSRRALRRLCGSRWPGQ